jgi:hypothetical protein
VLLLTSAILKLIDSNEKELKEASIYSIYIKVTLGLGILLFTTTSTLLFFFF